MRKAHILNQQPVTEKKLFHGSSPENVDTICEKNFDPRIHKNNWRLMLGQGTYFAVNAVSSHSNVKRESDLFQYMFLAKVLVGSYTKGDPSFQRPPAKDFYNVDTDLYDSCVDDISNPTIFVVFDRNHFYPEYVIQYLAAQPPSPGPLLLKIRPALIPSSSTQSSFSASAVSSAERTGATAAKCSENRSTASSPSGSATQSSGSASTVSNAEVTGTPPTRSSDNLDTASLLSGFATRSGYSASAVSSAELTGITATKSSDNLDAASAKGGTGAESSYSTSNLFSSELVNVETRLNAQTVSMLKGTFAERSYSISVVSGSEFTSVNPSKSTISISSVESIYSAYFSAY